MGPQAPPPRPPHPWQGLCSRYQYFRVKRLKTDGHRPKVTKIPWFRFHFSWPHPQVAPTWHIIIINIFTGWTSWHIANISCKQQINNFASIMVIANKYRHLHEHAHSLTHSPSLSRLGHKAKIKWRHSTLSGAFTWLDPMLDPSPPACSSPFCTRPQLLKSWIALSTG